MNTEAIIHTWRDNILLPDANQRTEVAHYTSIDELTWAKRSNHKLGLAEDVA